VTTTAATTLAVRELVPESVSLTMTPIENAAEAENPLNHQADSTQETTAQPRDTRTYVDELLTTTRFPTAGLKITTHEIKTLDIFKIIGIPPTEADLNSEAGRANLRSFFNGIIDRVTIHEITEPTTITLEPSFAIIATSRVILKENVGLATERWLPLCRPDNLVTNRSAKPVRFRVVRPGIVFVFPISQQLLGTHQNLSTLLSTI